MSIFEDQFGVIFQSVRQIRQAHHFQQAHGLQLPCFTACNWECDPIGSAIISSAASHEKRACEAADCKKSTPVAGHAGIAGTLSVTSRGFA